MTVRRLLIRSENGLETRDEYDGLSADSPTFTGALTGPYIVLTTDQGAFPVAVGAVFWNETEDTINVVRADGSTLSVGQENTMRMKDGTGAGLTDGQLVRVYDADGNNALVTLADADSHTSSSVIGMVTQAIAPNETGNIATSISVVNTLDTSVYPAGTELFLSSTPGQWTATPPAKPAHRVSIGFVLRQHAVNGRILLWINALHDLGELNDVDTTGATEGDSLALGAGGVWTPKRFIPQEAIQDAKQLSGFADPDSTTQAYDPVARTVTTTHPSGIVEMWFRGAKIQQPSPWVTPAHANTPGANFFFYSTDGVTFAWSTVAWTFYDIQVAFIRFGANLKIPVRECHGLMDPDAHEVLHRKIWTYIASGGSLTAGTYAIGGTASDANNTPGVDAAILRDEDLKTSINALPQGSYQVLRPVSGEFAADTLSVPFPVTPGGYINYYPTDSAVQGAPLKFYNVYLVAIPTMDPAHPLRYVWIAPQAQYDSLEAAQGEAFENLRLGDLSAGTSEYAPVYRLVYGARAEHATTGKVRLEAADRLERSPLRSTSTAASVLSGSGVAGQPAVWASPSSLTTQDAATFRATIGAFPLLSLSGAVNFGSVNGGLPCAVEVNASSTSDAPGGYSGGPAKGFLIQGRAEANRLTQEWFGVYGVAFRVMTSPGVWGAWSYLWDEAYLPISTFAKTLLDDTTAAQMRTTIGAAASAGVTNGSDASSGVVGEYLQVIRPDSDLVFAANGSAVSVLSLSLPAGDWDVEGRATAYITGTMNGNKVVSGLNTSVAIPADGTEVYGGMQVFSATNGFQTMTGSKRFSLAATTTVYLVARIDFSAGTPALFGFMSARRVR
jgi:hypothetical protein